MDDIVFPRDYRSGRSAFLGAAEAAGLSTISRVHPTVSGADGKPLFLDTVVVGPRDATRALLLIAGAHGGEDRFGSAVLAGLLRRNVLSGLPAKTCVVLLHALNPFGCAAGRRTDENGVDVSCNFADFSVPGILPLYETFSALVGAAGDAPAVRDAALAAFVQAHGAAALSRMMLCGQRNHPDGLFYGGKRPCWSHVMLLDILHEELRNAETVAALELRTGLGENGAGTLVCADPPSSAGGRLCARLFGDSVAPCAESSGIRPAFVQARPGAVWVSLCVGTLPPFDVLRILCAERSDGNAAGNADDAFCPSSLPWRRSGWAAAYRTVVRAMEGFARAV